jgi:hypothetical protein
MIDLGFAALLALVSAGFGKRILEWLRQSPERSSDALALTVPLGLGMIALATLALGALGCLNLFALAVLLAVFLELGIAAWIDWARTMHVSFSTHASNPDRKSLSLFFAFLTAVVLLGTAVTALTPVTDGDALCYHLQVPKSFLMRGETGFMPDLHETVYPLLTEMLYSVALEFRGPVACRGVQWVLGLIFAANVTALARPSLGCRAWWAGSIALAVPAVTNGMSAPLNDVALAAFGTAAIHAWVRLHERPGYRAAIAAGLFAGLAIGVKYPALVLCALLGGTIALRVVIPPSRPSDGWRRRWLALAACYLVMAVAVGGWWYLRAYVHTANPVYPFFRQFFGGSGLDEVLDPVKRPLRATPLNLLWALVPLSLQPDRFDSFSHQFGPVFLLFMPAVFLYRAPKRVLVLVALAFAFLAICLTQRQSMRFLLIALGPMSIAVAYLVSVWCDRPTVPARLLLTIVIAALAFEAGLAVARSRHVLPVLRGQESAAEFLARREPTFAVGQWTARNLPSSARLIGQDHRGFYIPRDYTMELAFRRRTRLGCNGESPREIVAKLRSAGFTHLMLCPPIPETAVEFDPTLGRLLAPWTGEQTPLLRRELADGDGVVRRYEIYSLSEEGLAFPPRPHEQLSALPEEGPTR